VDPAQAPKASGRTSVLEDLGVQILVMPGPFSIPMPVLNRSVLAPGESTTLGDCPPIALTGIRRAALTVACAFPAGHQARLQVCVRGSADGLAYDTSDRVEMKVDGKPDARAQKTVPLVLGPRFIRVVVKNPDRQAECHAVSVVATLEGG
jgi:hypothetical protein